MNKDMDGNQARERMIKVCQNCHSPRWAKNYMQRFDQAVLNYNDNYFKPVKAIMEELYEKGILTKWPVFDEEIEWMLDKAVKKKEVARAIKQAKALFAYASESITNQAFWLGYSEMFADYDWFETYLDRLSKVTPEQVLEVARRRLVPSRRVVGVYSPNGTASAP